MSDRFGVILYGPPASGKDTITRELHQLDPRFAQFPRLKIGGGRREGYRFIDQAELDQRTAAGDIAWVNHRYNATYAVDISGLQAHLSRNVTVLHLGQVQAVQAVQKATPDVTWRTIELWCPRDVATARLIARDPADAQRRLEAWDATEPLPQVDQKIDTGAVPAERAAEIIAALIPASD